MKLAVDTSDGKYGADNACEYGDYIFRYSFKTTENPRRRIKIRIICRPLAKNQYKHAACAPADANHDGNNADCRRFGEEYRNQKDNGVIQQNIQAVKR